MSRHITALLPALAISALVACAQTTAEPGRMVNTSFVHTAKAPVHNTEHFLRRACRRLDARQFPLPAGLPNGEYRSEPTRSGLRLHTVVKNGYPAQYVETVYSNGQIRSRHTLNAQGEAEGWSPGYAPDGKLRTRLLYRRGVVVRAQVYDLADGRIEQDQTIDCAARTVRPTAADEE